MPSVASVQRALTAEVLTLLDGSAATPHRCSFTGAPHAGICWLARVVTIKDRKPTALTVIGSVATGAIHIQLAGAVRVHPTKPCVGIAMSARSSRLSDAERNQGR